jgi:uncharacterized protein YjbJ (UPF0337 family)
MNRDILEGKWKQLRGEIRETWGELTDDEIDRVGGNAEKLAGLLQERYGWKREEATSRVADFLARVNARISAHDEEPVGTGPRHS